MHLQVIPFQFTNKQLKTVYFVNIGGIIFLFSSFEYIHVYK
ncbi:hypothetical protein RV13_GL001412 [Enterococcus raffinosus]|nr:hypothetical protein RV13_GL001412 [Enterococcus raffinosus]